jgi:hypothetical protein
MAYLVWHDKRDDYVVFKAYDHADAAEQYAELFESMGWSIPGAVHVDDENGDVQVKMLRRVQSRRYEAL